MAKGEAEKAEIEMLLEKLNASRADEGPDNQVSSSNSMGGVFPRLCCWLLAAAMTRGSVRCPRFSLTTYP
jgi:hypothetical protein